MARFSYDGHEIETSGTEPRLGDMFRQELVRNVVRDICLQGGILVTHGISWNSLPESSEVEEREMPKQPIEAASLGFERNRAKVINALRALVRGIVKECQLPTNNGLDIGSGATGAMDSRFPAGSRSAR